MKVYCLGYWDKELNTQMDCWVEQTIRSYEQLSDKWAVTSPAQRHIDGSVVIWAQCNVCCDAEEGTED